MAFLPGIKLKVKHLAAFRCCRCQSIGIEVHHIIPQEEDGPDTLDNAAPLCPNCHDYFGANPVKRKEIAEMRDWWYQQVKLQYKGQDFQQLEQINERVKSLTESDAERTQEMKELKEILKGMANQAIEDTTPKTAAITASLITDISRIKRIPIADLKMGPIKHTTLPSSFISRIKVIHYAFSDILKIPLDETIANFKRDMNPIREILIWEHIMGVYIDIVKNKKWSKEKKLDVFNILMALSMGPLHSDDLNRVKFLSKKEVEATINKWGESWNDQ